MLSVWRTEDFSPGLRQLKRFADPWEPAAEEHKELELSSPSPERVAVDFWTPRTPSFAGDFWDPLDPHATNNSEDVLTASPNWHDDILLPQFEPNASENPFWTKPEPSRSDLLIERRARWLLSLLDTPSETERKRHLRQFEELFDYFQHQSTFRALAEIVLDGASAEQIIAAFHLKLHWLANPRLWSIRPTRLRTLTIPEGGAKLLGWSRAARFVELSKGLPPEMIIDENWYDEWLALPFGDPSYWSFLDYVGARLEAFAAGMLDLPTELRRLDERPLGLETIRSYCIDGVALGSTSRSGHLARTETDSWSRSTANGSGNEPLSAGRI
ncbi:MULTISPECIES: hypothetical protein [unclassified Bradyrhizobium]|uniref:hypothetical protein n=1 Tax=unclassified Bradyrhizobium TaxID=2631580 RepID=UPI0028E1B954|nr:MULTISPECIES: hypothetical protein [unclassified Bradyrhizobium]